MKFLLSVLFAVGPLVLGCSGGAAGAATTKCSDSPTGAACSNGASIQACVDTNADGTCAGARYAVGSQTFACASCVDCAQAAQAAAQACGGTGADAGGPSGDASSGSAGSASDLLGTWSCSGTSTIVITTPPNTPSQTTDATSTIVIAAQGPGEVVVISPSEGGADCSLVFATSGATASLIAGQSCAGTSSAGPVTETATSGSLTLAGGVLTVSAAFSFSEGGPVVVAGTSTGRSTCSK